MCAHVTRMYLHGHSVTFSEAGSDDDREEDGGGAAHAARELPHGHLSGAVEATQKRARRRMFRDHNSAIIH